MMIDHFILYSSVDKYSESCKKLLNRLMGENSFSSNILTICIP